MMKEMLEKKMKAVKPRKGEDMAEGSSKEYYPTVHFDSKTLPEIKDWKVGREYTVILKIKQTSLSVHEEEASASFDILKVGVKGEEKKEKSKNMMESIKEKYGI